MEGFEDCFNGSKKINESTKFLAVINIFRVTNWLLKPVFWLIRIIGSKKAARFLRRGYIWGRRKAVPVLNRFFRKKIIVNEDLKRCLAKRYEEDNKKVSEMIGENLRKYGYY